MLRRDLGSRDREQGGQHITYRGGGCPWQHHSLTGWYLAAGGLFAIGTALWMRVVALLSAANPSVPLPWIGWPANRPRGVKLQQFLAIFAVSLGMSFLYNGLDSARLYVLWAIPIGATCVVVDALIPYSRHNRQVRRHSAT